MKLRATFSNIPRNEKVKFDGKCRLIRHETSIALYIILPLNCHYVMQPVRLKAFSALFKYKRARHSTTVKNEHAHVQVILYLCLDFMSFPNIFSHTFWIYNNGACYLVYFYCIRIWRLFVRAMLFWKTEFYFAIHNLIWDVTSALNFEQLSKKLTYL